VAAVLGLSDLLADGPLSVAEVAERSGCHAGSLHRLLRALATAGLYAQFDDGRFGNTALGDALRTDAPRSPAGHAAYIGRPYFRQAWSALLHSVRTGENAFESVHGMSVWDYRAAHPEESEIFDASMTSQSRFVAEQVLDAYDFGRFTKVVDVGGGRGAFIAAILVRWPHLAGVLFDQAHVVAGAPELMEAAGVADRCRVVAGSFFETVPADGDAYVFKSVIHDWLDEHAVAILRVCRDRIPGSATLHLVERVITGGSGDFEAAFSDLNMLVAPGGQERTTDEYAALLAAAGFRLTAVHPTAGDAFVVEAVPA